MLNKAEEYGVLDVFESNRVSKDDGIELNNNNQIYIIFQVLMDHINQLVQMLLKLSM